MHFFYKCRSPQLFAIINHSSSHRLFPDNLKIAKIIPLFQSGDRESLNNYRPISLHPDFSKIFDNII